MIRLKNFVNHGQYVSHNRKEKNIINIQYCCAATARDKLAIYILSKLISLSLNRSYISCSNKSTKSGKQKN